MNRRGFTLLEVMIASAIGVVVLAVGLVAGMQMQRRALFEEQTMIAQVTGRAVKDLIAADLQRAGLGMGNSPIAFGGDVERYAIQTWFEPDMTAVNEGLEADLSFEQPPTGTLYEDLRSDVLRLYWGDTRDMLTMGPCGSGQLGPTNRIRAGGSDVFCTMADPPTGLAPASADPTPAILLNPNEGVACHINISNFQESADRFNANPGSNSLPTTRDECEDPTHAVWGRPGWITMRAMGSAYRVNWAGGAPVLEYLAPGSAVWAPVSRNVERLKVRVAVIDPTAPNDEYRWFPLEGTRPAIDQCEMDTPGCELPAGVTALTDLEHRNRLRELVREVEVTLTVRTRRPDRGGEYDPSVAPTEQDEEGFPVDGFKRRTFTFRVTPRNYAASQDVQ